MSVDDSLGQAIVEWRSKHRIADDDPIIATLDLVRIYLTESRKVANDSDDAPPSFDDFRGTIELLDRRSKTLVHQGADLIAELRLFGQNVRRLNQARFLVQLVLVVISIISGVLLGRWL